MAGSALAISAGAGVYSTFVEPHWLDIRAVKIPLPHLPPSFEGFTILQLSDVHHGKFVPASYIENCIQRVSHLEPDVIALTGDFVSGDARYAFPCAEILKTLKSKQGIFAIAGNHDYWTDISTVSKAFHKEGIPLFRNQHTVFRRGGEKILFGGFDDLWGGTPDFFKTFPTRAKKELKIMMAHNPDVFELNFPFDIDFIMAGHTHGGQVSLPFYGPPIIPSSFGNKYASGFFKRGGMRMYVNRGLGVIFPPVRFRVRPEITLCTLTRSG